MERNLLKSIKRKQRRVLRIRRKINGSSDMPRICVNKTNRYLVVQVINDDESKTLVSATSMSKDYKSHKALNKEVAQKLGHEIAEKCKKQGIMKAVFDRRGNKYHGILASLADAVREKGLKL